MGRVQKAGATRRVGGKRKRQSAPKRTRRAGTKRTHRKRASRSRRSRRSRRQRGGNPDMAGVKELNEIDESRLNEDKVRRIVAAATMQFEQANELVKDFDKLVSLGPTAGYGAWLANWAGIRVTSHSSWGNYTEPGKIEALRHATTGLEAAIAEINRALGGEAIYRQQYDAGSDDDGRFDMDWNMMGRTLIRGRDRGRGGQGLMNKSLAVSDTYWPARKAYDALVAKIAEDKRLAKERAAEEANARAEAEIRRAQQEHARNTILRPETLPGRNQVGDRLPPPDPPTWGEWAGSFLNL